MALPYTFGTQTGTIPLNELDENFTYLENLVPALAVAAGTVITASQPNITAVGTLTALNCSGTVTAGTVTAGILNGTLSANAQPNITEIGTLTNLTVANTLLAGTVTATTVGTPGGSLIGTVAIRRLARPVARHPPGGARPSPARRQHVCASGPLVCVGGGCTNLYR